MDVQKAQQLMTEAIHAMVACGQFKTAQMTAVRTMVSGKPEDVTCIFFGSSEDVLEAMTTRVTGPSYEERIATSFTQDAISRARVQREQK